MNEAITAYPLQWPAGWKRAGPASRVAARFGKAGRQVGYGDQQRWTSARALTIAEGTARVLGELKRMGLGRDDVEEAQPFQG